MSCTHAICREEPGSDAHFSTRTPGSDASDAEGGSWLAAKVYAAMAMLLELSEILPRHHKMSDARFSRVSHTRSLPPPLESTYRLENRATAGRAYAAAAAVLRDHDGRRPEPEQVRGSARGEQAVHFQIKSLEFWVCQTLLYKA